MDLHEIEDTTDIWATLSYKRTKMGLTMTTHRALAELEPKPGGFNMESTIPTLSDMCRLARAVGLRLTVVEDIKPPSKANLKKYKDFQEDDR
jgi:hypothetical protein